MGTRMIQVIKKFIDKSFILSNQLMVDATRGIGILRTSEHKYNKDTSKGIPGRPRETPWTMQRLTYSHSRVTLPSDGFIHTSTICKTWQQFWKKAFFCLQVKEECQFPKYHVIIA